MHPASTIISANSTVASTVSDPQPTTKQILTTMTLPPLSTLHSSVCHLKTAIADVSGDSTTFEGHIVIDKGAQRSFITQELVNLLQPTPVHHELINLRHRYLHRSDLRSHHFPFMHTLSSGKILISVLMVPKLTSPV